MNSSIVHQFTIALMDVDIQLIQFRPCDLRHAANADTPLCRYVALRQGLEIFEVTTPGCNRQSSSLSRTPVQSRQSTSPKQVTVVGPAPFDSAIPFLDLQAGGARPIALGQLSPFATSKKVRLLLAGRCLLFRFSFLPSGVAAP
jgi:hypothetical protein